MDTVVTHSKFCWLVNNARHQNIGSIRVDMQDATSLPENIRVHGALHIENGKHLTSLPKLLRCRDLIITDCPSLETIRTRLPDTQSIELRNCKSLKDFTAHGEVFKILEIRNCPSLQRLSNFECSKSLTLENCKNFDSLDIKYNSTLSACFRHCQKLRFTEPTEFGSLALVHCPTAKLSNALEIKNVVSCQTDAAELHIEPEFKCSMLWTDPHTVVVLPEKSEIRNSQVLGTFFRKLQSKTIVDSCCEKLMCLSNPEKVTALLTYLEKHSTANDIATLLRAQFFMPPAVINSRLSKIASSREDNYEATKAVKRI